MHVTIYFLCFPFFMSHSLTRRTLIQTEVAQGIAKGNVDPFTMMPFQVFSPISFIKISCFQFSWFRRPITFGCHTYSPLQIYALLHLCSSFSDIHVSIKLKFEGNSRQPMVYHLGKILLLPYFHWPILFFCPFQKIDLFLIWHFLLQLILPNKWILRCII